MASSINHTLSRQSSSFASSAGTHSPLTLTALTPVSSPMRQWRGRTEGAKNAALGKRLSWWKGGETCICMAIRLSADDSTSKTLPKWSESPRRVSTTITANCVSASFTVSILRTLCKRRWECWETSWRTIKISLPKETVSGGKTRSIRRICESLIGISWRRRLYFRARTRAKAGKEWLKK